MYVMLKVRVMKRCHLLVLLANDKKTNVYKRANYYSRCFLLLFAVTAAAAVAAASFFFTCHHHRPPHHHHHHYVRITFSWHPFYFL